MRIVGGTRRGLTLDGPERGDTTIRPTSDRVRESLFNVLTNGRAGDRVAGARVLDLFAGTGALALEALSRGAVSATLVERASKARAIVARNIAKAGFDDAATLLGADATRLPSAPPGGPADLVFLDPPYGRSMGERALASARDGGWIAPGALIVWEESAEIVPPAGFTPGEIRRYGDTRIAFLTFS